MRKKTTYDIRGRQYYQQQKAKGWLSYSVFGNPALIQAVKDFCKQYKSITKS